MALSEFLEVDDEAGRKKAIVEAIETVAEQLGNTPAVCRACYVHPEVIDAYLDGTMVEALSRAGPWRRSRRPCASTARRLPCSACSRRGLPASGGVAGDPRPERPQAASPNRSQARW